MLPPLDAFHLKRGFRHIDRPRRWNGSLFTQGAVGLLAPAWYRRLTGCFDEHPTPEDTSEPENLLGKDS